MKAITRSRFGGPEILTFDRSPEPAVGDDDVLVDVHAAGLNQGDVLELRGWPYIGRLTGYGLRRPRRSVPGTDVAGRVVAVGRAVSPDAVRIGDDVVGWGDGVVAELAVARSDRVVVRPGSLPPEAAAALPTAGTAALQAVRDAGRVEAGQRVLVVGASGGVGTFAVQIATTLGADVTGVSGTRHVELVRSLGAHHVVDYTREDITDVTARHGRYDVIVDLVGNHPIGTIRRALTDTGTLVVVGGRNPRSVTGVQRFAAAAIRSPFVRHRLVPLFARPDRDDLATLVALVANGSVRPVVGATYDLPDAAEAFRRLETGHATGKLVVTV